MGAEYRGERGPTVWRCRSTTVLAMVLGREGLGFLKKLADHISLERDGARVVAVVRHGVAILRIEGDAHEEIIPEPGWGTREVRDLEGRPAGVFTSFLFRRHQGGCAATVGDWQVMCAPGRPRPRRAARSPGSSLISWGDRPDALSDGMGEW